MTCWLTRFFFRSEKNTLEKKTCHVYVWVVLQAFAPVAGTWGLLGILCIVSALVGWAQQREPGSWPGWFGGEVEGQQNDILMKAFLDNGLGFSKCARNIKKSYPPWKLTWRWKIHHEWRCISYWKWWIFQCYLSFQGCSWYSCHRWLQDWDLGQGIGKHCGRFHTNLGKIYGGFLKWWYPQSPPQVLILFSRKKPMGWLGNTHHFRKPSYRLKYFGFMILGLDDPFRMMNKSTKNPTNKKSSTGRLPAENTISSREKSSPNIWADVTILCHTQKVV